MVGDRPASTERLRRQNAALVLRSLRRLGPATRAELAQRTGLAKATVGVIVAGLEAAGAVTEEESRSGARGRPGRPVALSGERWVGVGLELNVDYVAAVVVDLAGGVVHHEVRPVEGGRTGHERALLGLAEAVRDRCRAAGQVSVGATVAVPALVRGDNRTVAWAPNLALEGPDLADRVADLLGTPVRVGNDANCAAYAEARHGAAAGVRHALYLTGTVGIGAGIVDRGELVRGGAGFAGEVGHMPVGDPTARCGCGRVGCWEASVGLHAMLAAVGMPELATPLETAAAVAQRAATDAEVRAALGRVGEAVGLGLAMLAGVLDPEVVVLGGYFVPLGDLVLEPARRTLDARLASAAQVRPELRLSTLGIEAAALGAAEQAFADVLAGDVDLTAGT
ncbi:ROK family transcriptional regulator [Nocardioides dongkuii]|uniref:ROK family transcriptional regulator n=1 Tax=Nocardioides dongkuii TaxID=2760089 RepID=UPI0015FCED4F|nr:ROK family transcriptional regulator [Nocardioides dongkuii]